MQILFCGFQPEFVGICVLQLSKTQTKFKYLEHLATSVEVSSNLSANWSLS